MDFGTSLTSVGEWVILAAAVIAALGVIWAKAVRPVIKFGKRIATMLETVETRTVQLAPNGGSHLADSIRRNETKMDTLATEFADHRRVSAQNTAAQLLHNVKQAEHIADLFQAQARLANSPMVVNIDKGN